MLSTFWSLINENAAAAGVAVDLSPYALAVGSFLAGLAVRFWILVDKPSDGGSGRGRHQASAERPSWTRASVDLLHPRYDARDLLPWLSDEPMALAAHDPGGRP